ncbi:MAG: hypothetical protein RRY64_10205, partial [Oscillospiraceae bacterium]
LTWELAESTGTLTISGTGAMWDYSWDIANQRSTAPWYGYIYQNQLHHLLIADGVTTIGAWTFRDCCSFTGNLVIPSGVTT